MRRNLVLSQFGAVGNVFNREVWILAKSQQNHMITCWDIQYTNKTKNTKGKAKLPLVLGKLRIETKLKSSASSKGKKRFTHRRTMKGLIQNLIKYLWLNLWAKIVHDFFLGCDKKYLFFGLPSYNWIHESSVWETSDVLFWMADWKILLHYFF